MRMKEPHPHACRIQHRTYRSFVVCASGATWIDGDGPYAVMRWCRYPRFTLAADLAAVEHEQDRLDRDGCGYTCEGEHEIIDLDDADSVIRLSRSPGMRF